MRNNAVISSILTMIGAIIFLGITLLLFVTGMKTPIPIVGNPEGVYLYEYPQYQGGLAWYVFLIFYFLTFAIIGIIFSIRVRKKATTLQGVTLIVIGIVTLLSTGGIFYLIGGIQAILARNRNKEILM